MCVLPYLCMPEAQCSCRAHVVVEGLYIHTQGTSSNVVHEALHTADSSMDACTRQQYTCDWLQRFYAVACRALLHEGTCH